MFIVGLVLTFYAFRLAGDVQNKKDCLKKNVLNATRGLLVMGVAIMSIAGTYLLIGTASTYTDSMIGMMLVVLMLAMGITVIVLTSIIHSGCPEARSETNALLVLSVIVTAVSGSYLLYKGYGMVQRGGMKASF